MSEKLHLFEGFGIELEYMIVKKNSLSVLPVTDEVMHRVAKKYVSDVDMGEVEWSNELVLHVIELKTNGPAKKLVNLPEIFHENILHINKLLEPLNGKLMPSAMHPWMDPYKEMKLWPYDCGPVYESYNRIFDCRGHGWANLQSTHINLPFADDKEFEKLHAAVRLILPILPAMAASSPIAENRVQRFKDFRLEVYRKNQQRVPSIAGKIIPERAFSKKDYEEEILNHIYKDIAEHDPMGILQHEWLNSRGAIARFERNTIEIRLLDVQECPQADIAIAAFIVEVVKALIDEKWMSLKEQKNFHENDLSAILLDAIRDAEDATISSQQYLNVFGIDKAQCSAKDIWQHLFNKLMQGEENKKWEGPLRLILNEGTLSTRILKAVGDDASTEKIKSVYARLCDCLAENKMFIHV